MPNPLTPIFGGRLINIAATKGNFYFVVEDGGEEKHVVLDATSEIRVYALRGVITLSGEAPTDD